MKSNSGIRRAAFDLLQGQWGSGIAVVVITFVFSAMASGVAYEYSGIQLLINLLLIAPLSFGVTFHFLRWVKTGTGEGPKGMWDGFTQTYYKQVVILALLKTIYIFLWSLLLIVPGIIKSYSYAMASYILAENPEISGEEAICRSMRMMEGYKMKLFLMDLGRIGLIILSLPLLCIPMLWICPYYATAFAKFYTELKAETGEK